MLLREVVVFVFTWKKVFEVNKNTFVNFVTFSLSDRFYLRLGFFFGLKCFLLAFYGFFLGFGYIYM